MAGKNFGFVTQACRQIDLDHLVNPVAGEIAAEIAASRACIGCGSCAATCPGGFNFRLHLTGIQLTGFQNLSAVKACYLCGKCQLVCPRGIPSRYLIIRIMQLTNELKHVTESIPSV